MMLPPDPNSGCVQVPHDGDGEGAKVDVTDVTVLVYDKDVEDVVTVDVLLDKMVVVSVIVDDEDVVLL